MEQLTTTIDLLRHGACEGGEIYRGTTDVNLSAQGLEQMNRAVASPADWQHVISSPLVRCKNFAKTCSSNLELPLTIESGFREIDFGEWEGRLVADVWRDDRERVENFFADPAQASPPGGEHVNDVVTRVAGAWSELMSKHAGEHLLLVSHGGVMRILISYLLGMPLASISRLHVPYACMARLSVIHRDEGQFPVLVSLNSEGNS